MDVASGDGKETPTSKITSTTNPTASNTQKERTTGTLNSSGNTVIKDDAGSSSSSSKSNVSSSISDTSRPSTDSTTTTTTGPLYNSDCSLKCSNELVTTSTTDIVANSMSISTPKNTKSDFHKEHQEKLQEPLNQFEIEKIELNQKAEGNPPQNQATNQQQQQQQQQTTVIGTPLARSSPISREYLALQKSLNESKILTEFVADTSAIKAARKGRKSGLSSMRDSPSHKGTANRVRSIDPLNISNEEHQRSISKRNMRSQNAEFAQKHMEYLNRVINQQQSGDEQYGSETDEVERYASVNNDEDDDQTSANVSNSGVIAFDLAEASSLEARLMGIWQPAPKRGSDSFCWRCRESHNSTLIPCSKCPRCFHKHCVKMSSYTKLDSSWLCPECLAVENALNSPKKSRRPDLSLDMLSELLTYALKRMRTSKGSGKFLFSEGDYSHLSKYIVNPVTFTTLEEKIAKKVFRCPEEFYNETKWMVHNAHIITTGFSNHKLLVTAKAIVKICRQEANEIETCAGCYLSANTRPDWFVDVCAQPHILLWAKLKGFPYWPAKAMGIGQNSVVNVRFFGKHDRAFVPIKDCYLYSREDANMQTGKRSARELADCIKEVEEHIKNIEAKIGKFNYAPLRTPYDPNDELQQLEAMMPGVGQYIKRQAQTQVLKPSLQYKIVKTAGNHLSIIKKGGDKESNEDNSDISNAANDSLAEIMPIRKENKAATGGNNANGSTSSGVETTKHTISTKYEVITKTTASDSDSTPKVTAVILKKRKTSNQNDLEKEETASEPKLTKTQNDTIVVMGNKRKQQSLERSPGETSDSGSEKQRAKHARTEPRLPILTIKTGCAAKLVEHASARDVVEHLSKTNTGVTIKKVNKSPAAVLETAVAAEIQPATEAISRATRSSAKEAATKSTTANGKDNKNINVTETITSSTTTTAAAITPTALRNVNEKNATVEKADRADDCRNIFRELVPFVEVKQEVCSDAEDAEMPAADRQITTTTTATTTKAATNKEKEAPTTVAANVENQTIPNEETSVSLLNFIKAEVMSDEEAGTPQINTGLLNAVDASKGASISHNTQDSGIRVVGDTIIQRLSAKQTSATQQQTTALNNIAATSIATAKGAALAATSPPNVAHNKRVSTRSGGVPYGPFPAAAATSSSLSLTGSKSANSTNPVNETAINEMSQQHSGQRARKTFANVSPTRMITTMPTTATQRQLATASPPTLSLNPSTTNIAHNNKQNNILKSTSMVSIPADIAAQRNITQNAVPMPPLTAVSKTMPVTASATNTIAGTAPNVSMTRVGSITPAAFASSNSVNSNNNNSSNSANSFTPPTKLTAPPPLAGLSTFATVSQLQQQQQQQQPTPTSNATTLLPTANIATTSSINSNSNSSNNNSNNSNNNSTNNNCSTFAPDQTNTTGEPTSAENHLLGEFVTPALANAITEVICRGPPRMAPRPNGPLQSDGSTMFPSEAGPVCRTLVQNAHKLTDFFISVMEDTMCEMSNNDEPSLQAKITLLTMELERMKQAHEREIAELKRTSDLMLCEMRKSMENEKTRITNEIRKNCELERLRAVDEAKRKQWCANCVREAQFYCCWNTSYCDYPCQQQHWSRHAASCAQTRGNSESAASGGGNTIGVGNMQPMVASANSINQLPINSDGRNKNSTSTVNVHYNKSVGNSKKDKANNAMIAKNAVNVAGGMSPVVVGLSADMLKLPSNTSLRPVSVANASSTQTRPVASATTQQQQQQPRFNISLPISSSSNVNPRSSSYKFVQRGNNWELMTPPTTNAMTSMSTISTVTGPQQATLTQQRSAPNLNLGRTRGVSIMSYNPTINGNMRSTQM